MGQEIVLRMDVHEALIALGRLSDAHLAASKLAAISTGDEHEIADVTSKILGRLTVRLTDEIYPTCVYPRGDGDEVCGKEFAGTNKGHAFCRFHLDLETMHDIGQYPS